MTTPSLLCRVQALYTFESDDPSSLKFEEGDYIDVLTKLPSGWWDGWCNGNRGWFPSNYVKIIEDYSNTTEPSSSPPNKLNSELFDDKVGISGSDSKRTSLPPNWSIQNREDGSASYYFNTITGEMRSTFPYNEPFYEVESDEDSTTSTIESKSELSSNVISDDSQKSTQQKWVQRTTPQGLPFFYNLSTHESAWHADSQEQQGLPNTKSPRDSYMIQTSPSFDSREAFTWNKLSLHITLAINNLIASAKNSQRSLYKNYTANVVEAVRFMLIASGTINKESAHIKTNNVLRSHHRVMMASMSKLVLSSQLCADGSMEDVSKLLSDCHELLVAVRNFISTCEIIPVEIHYVDPIMLKDVPWEQKRQNSISSGSLDNSLRAKYELQTDLIENLDAYGASMQESMESLMANLTRHSDSRASLAVLLFTQYRNFGSQNGQFLSIIEDIDFEIVSNSPLMKKLSVAKQKLYDGLGLLFFKMQTMTDQSVPMNKVIQDMQEAASCIISAIKSVCQCMAELVAEKNRLIKENPSLETIKSNRSSLLESSDAVNPLSSFLKSTSGNNDLSFNFSSSFASNNIDDLHRYNGKRSQSVSIENHTNTMNHLKSNRSSAPITESSSNLIMAEALKHRSHTEILSKNMKSKQLFGDDDLGVPLTSPNRSENTLRKPSITPSTDTTTTVTNENDLPFLQYDYGPNEIAFMAEGNNVKGGTLRALVERMTLHDYLDMNFNSNFLLTYRSFCTSMELLELLEERYNIQAPPDLTPEELDIWTNKKQKLIRLRVFNVLKIWLEQYYYEEDSVILDRLLFFTNTSIKDTLSFSAYQLERLIHKRKEACKDLKKMVITQPQDSPEPILPRNLKKFRLLDLDTTELARQLTLMDFKLYSSIKPVECLDKAWSRDASANDDQHTPIAKNIQASINYCNQVTTWVSDEILSQSEVKKRSILIKYWVNVAERCRMFNNFNTCMAILSAFDNSAVGRLKRTWEMVGARTNHIVSQLRRLMGANRNFNNYRAIIHSINPPCIPFLGIYLQDLTFIEDGNPNFLKTSKELINFAKRAKTAEVIREIQQYQTMGYQFRPVEEIQTFITESLHSARDEDQLYKESLKLEPKEREDEKITRLLQESGFL